MKVLPDKNNITWLLILLAVVAAIVIYRIGFHTPVPGFNQEALKSLGLQVIETQPDRAEPVFQTSYAVDLMREPLKEPRYGSERPLYFCVVFGKEGKNPMLGVVDESGGTDAGYDVAYVDENMNGDLTDDTAKEFPRRESGSRTGELEPRFDFVPSTQSISTHSHPGIEGIFRGMNTTFSGIWTLRSGTTFS